MSKKLSIGIIGTRGIPNEYGGYEAAVQELAPRLADRGHKVVVYCSKSQESRLTEWHDVSMVYSCDPEKYIGSAGQFIYDLISNVSSYKFRHDVIFHMGYTSDSIWYKLWDKRAIHITNMDGMEWMRTKYSKRARKFLSYAEKLAATKSHCLIADNKGIQDYLEDKFRTPVIQISYGVNIPISFNDNCLSEYSLQANKYDLVIARIVPENNIETAILAKINTKSNIPLVIFGNRTKFRDELMEKYSGNKNIVFEEGNFNKDTMDGLRYYSRYYIHGHSVGGTNPSLLEAMAARSRIIAHNNAFNKNVLLDGGDYFLGVDELSELLSVKKSNIKEDYIELNISILKRNNNWDSICDQYEEAALKY